MRPVLRPDNYPVAVDGGVYILRPGEPVRLTGASVAQWLARLTPYLDGRATVEELTAALSVERRELVRRLLRELHASGVVRDADEDREPAGPGEGWRHLTALVVGAGPLLPASVRALLRSGVRRVEAVVVGGGPSDLAALRQVGARARRRDPQQRLACRSGDTAPRLAGVGLVLHLIDGEATAPQPATLERRCAAAGVPLAQVVSRDGEVWSLPVDLTGNGLRWSAIRPRLVAAGPAAHPAGGAAPAPADASQPSAVTTAAFAVAAAAVYRALRAVTGQPGGPEPARPLRLALPTLQSSHHPVLPHPFAAPAAPPTAVEFEARLRALAEGAPLTEVDLSTRAVAAVDERLGLLALTEHDWAQSPLFVSQARVRRPAATGGPTGGPTVTAAGFTYLTARCRATLAGLARYAAIALDPRRLCDRAGAPAELPADPWQALAAVRTGAVPATVWGWELAGPGRARLLPVEQAFVLDGPLPGGVAAGYDWSAAVATGLLRHCLRLTREEARGSAGPAFARVDLAGAELAAEGARCRAILTDLGELPEAYELTGSLGVPAYAFCHNGRTVADTAGLTAAAALGDGLRRALRLAQAQAHRQLGYAPAPVPELPVARRGQRAREPVEPARPLTVSTLAERLRAAGRPPVAVPLDHDPAVSAILPYLVNVVVVDG